MPSIESNKQHVVGSGAQSSSGQSKDYSHNKNRTSSGSGDNNANNSGRRTRGGSNRRGGRGGGRGGKSNAPCRFFFQQGSCRRGDECNFSHTNKPGQQGNGNNRNNSNPRTHSSNSGPNNKRGPRTGADRRPQPANGAAPGGPVEASSTPAAQAPSREAAPHGVSSIVSTDANNGAHRAQAPAASTASPQQPAVNGAPLSMAAPFQMPMGYQQQPQAQQQQQTANPNGQQSQQPQQQQMYGVQNPPHFMGGLNQQQFVTPQLQGNFLPPQSFFAAQGPNQLYNMPVPMQGFLPADVAAQMNGLDANGNMVFGGADSREFDRNDPRYIQEQQMRLYQQQQQLAQVAYSLQLKQQQLEAAAGQAPAGPSALRASEDIEKVVANEPAVPTQQTQAAPVEAAAAPKTESRPAARAPVEDVRKSSQDNRDNGSRSAPYRPPSGSGRFSSGDARGDSRDNNGGRQNSRKGSGRSNPNRRNRLAPRDPEEEKRLFGEKTTGINFDSYDDIPVEATGNDVPAHCEDFETMNLHEHLIENIALAHFERPTPVQKYSVPTLLADRDIMSCAQTGSGKTGAFLFPIINRLLTGEVGDASGGRKNYRKSYPSSLILAPTRELATQIYEEACKFTYRTDIKCVVVYGGHDIRTQMRELDRGCDILVATPGRLVDFVERGRISLSQCCYLVFDEADRMLDMGFEPQIRHIVQGCDMMPTRQTVMFSATFPKEIQRLAQEFLHDYVFLAVGRVGASSELISQKVEYVEENGKKERLMYILPQCDGLTLVFVERKRSADLLEHFLVEQGVNAMSIHGDRTQDEREYALAMFRCGRCPVLVATDVAARGLDIPNVMFVVNYDLPHSIDDYVHRIGRTGRCGNNGTAIAFVNDRNRNIVRELYDVMKEAQQTIPSWFEEMALTINNRPARSAPKRGGKAERFGARDVRGNDFSQGREKETRKGSKGGKKKKAEPTAGGWESLVMGGPSGGYGGSYAYDQTESNDAW